jgi:glycosyltransferase involved in cell wall biosynthesis
MSSASSGAPAYDISAATPDQACGQGPQAGPAKVPRVSVIVLNRNGERIIGKCLDHLLAQTFDDFDILLVDDNSADGSIVVAESYLGCGKLSIVRSHRNLGVPGARNLGLVHAKGEILAFIDNDGYAHKEWLAAALRTLESDDKIGAIASVVFFANRKTILNACGGTINQQGYGGDFCYHIPYEFADIPREVLFPMGCGIVLRRKALSQTWQFDSRPIKWYEDVELGIWLWACGYKVVVAQDAWIDHGWGFSDAFLPDIVHVRESQDHAFLPDRAYMCERARIRNVLKYYPARRLMSWLSHEVSHFAHAAGTMRSVLIKAWLWNLHHLPSAWRWRLRIRRHKAPFWHLIDSTWGYFPGPVPDDAANYLDLKQAHSTLLMDGRNDMHQLNFGWYEAETDAGRTFRWSARQASVLFRFHVPVLNCTIAFAGS